MLKKILVISGESSGDLLALELIRKLRSKQNDLFIAAMGGNHLANVVDEVIVDSTHLGVVGFLEVLTHFNLIRAAFKKIKNFISEQKPILIILIDYPGFNLRIAQFAKKNGIKVLYYVSPQIWAWKYGRIKLIKQCVDHMAVLFPFEEKIYQKEQVPVTFVGHPLAEIVKPNQSKEECYNTWQLDSKQPIISLFPGSRKLELKRLLPVVIKTARKIKQNIQHAQFLLCLNERNKDLLQQELQHLEAVFLKLNIKPIFNQTYNALSISDAAIAASGTVTLEIALSKVPLVIIYKVALLSAIFVKIVLKIPYIGLCNIVAEELVARELLQYQATPNNIANEVLALLQNHNYRNNILNKLTGIRDKLASENAAEKTAGLVLEMLVEPLKLPF